MKKTLTFSKNTDKDRAMHSKNNNIEIMINDRVDEVIEDLVQLLLSIYQIGSETSIEVTTLSLIVFICCITNVIT